MVEETIKTIKETENEADEIIRKADATCTEILEKAAREAKEIKEQAVANAKKQAEADLLQAKEEGEVSFLRLLLLGFQLVFDGAHPLVAHRRDDGKQDHRRGKLLVLFHALLIFSLRV